MSSNLDLFLRKDGGRARFELNLFHNHVDDFIYLTANDRSGNCAADRAAADFDMSNAILPAPTDCDWPPRLLFAASKWLPM